MKIGEEGGKASKIIRQLELNNWYRPKSGGIVKSGGIAGRKIWP